MTDAEAPSSNEQPLSAAQRLAAIKARFQETQKANAEIGEIKTEKVEERSEETKLKSKEEQEGEALVEQGTQQEKEAKERRDYHEERLKFYQRIDGQTFDVVSKEVKSFQNQQQAPNGALEESILVDNNNFAGENPGVDGISTIDTLSGIHEIREKNQEQREIEAGQRAYNLLKYDFLHASEEAFTEPGSPFRRVIAAMPRIADSTSQELVAQNYQTTDKSFDHMLNNFVVQSLLVAKEHGITPDPTDPLAPITDPQNPFFISLDGIPKDPANWRNPLKVAEDISQQQDAAELAEMEQEMGNDPPA